MGKRVLSVMLIFCVCFSVGVFFSLEAEAATGQDIVNFAKSVNGVYYNPNNGESRLGPNTFDCSGFVYYVCKNVGISISNGNTETQRSYGTDVNHNDLRSYNDYSKLQPGDLIFMDWSGGNSSGHVGIYIGNGKMIHCWSKAGTPIKTSNLSDWGTDTGRIYSYVCDVRRVASTTSSQSTSRPIAPTTVTVSAVNNDIIYSDEPFKISWSGAQNVTEYELRIMSNGQTVFYTYSIKPTESSYILSLPAGNYKVAVVTVNHNFPTSQGINYAYSEYIDFVVKEDCRPIPPSLVTISPLEGSGIYSNEDFKVCWSGAKNATEYELRVMSNGQTVFYTYSIKPTESSYILSLPAGKYDVAVVTVNENIPEDYPGINYAYSEYVKFEVLSTPYFNAFSLKISNKPVVFVDTNCINTPIFVSVYKQGKCIDIQKKVFDGSSDSLSFPISGDFDEVKVMMFDSLAELKPKYEAKVLTKADWK